MIRAFLALELPEQARAELGKWQSAQLRGKRAPRPVPEQQLHVTVRFLHNRRQAELDTLAAGIDRLALPNTVATRVVGIGGFPSARKATVLVAKLEDAEGELARLHQEVSELLEGMGIEPDARAFVAHVTLARFGKPDDTAPYVTNPHAFSTFALTTLTLFRSELSERGAQHFPLRSWQLAQAARALR